MPGPRRRKTGLGLPRRQVLNTKIVTQIPIGEFWNVTAIGKNVALQPSSMVTVYWGIDKR